MDDASPVGAVEVNAAAQGALRQFMQLPWVERITFFFFFRIHKQECMLVRTLIG